jgi:hypothetical protein
VSSSDEFDSVRREPDPLRRGRRATELLTIYQQRATELARLRRAAIEQARHESGMSYTEIAAALGLTKGRVTQIKGTAPVAERAFFGVGPVTIAMPLRAGVVRRERILIAAEDAATVDQLEAVLAEHALASARATIAPDSWVPPAGDAIVVCGPKSAPVAARLLDRDPWLAMVEDDGQWSILDRRSGRQLSSPSDSPAGPSGDIAYLGRHVIDGRVVVHIAGIHAVGSFGMAHYLTRRLADLFREFGEDQFSLAATCTYEGLEIRSSAIAAGPYRW